MTKRPVTFYLWTVVLLGIVAFCNNVFLHSYIAVHVAVRDILYILVAVAIFLSGRAARTSGRTPMAVGAMLGTIYGVLIGLSTFFFHVSAAEEKVLLQAQNLPTHKLAEYTKAINSVQSHVMGLIAAAIMLLVLGFIIGFVGGATTEKPTKNGEKVPHSK